MKICEQTLLHKLYGMIMINLPAKELVEKAFHQKDAFHASGELIFLENYCPW
jgi:hypothetical protein